MRKFPFLTAGALLASVTLVSQAAEPEKKKSVLNRAERNYIKETGFTYGPWRSSVLGGGGYIQNVVPCPTDPKRLYSYVDVGGVYRSDDGGETWRMMHGTLPPGLGSMEVRGLLVDPRDAKHVVIASGSQWVGKAAGISVSTDGGETWERTLTARYTGNGGTRSTGFILARHPANPDILITASVSDGVWKSVDNGKTWTDCGGKDLHPTDIRFDRANPERLWMCASGSKIGKTEFVGGLHRSEDGGATWNKLSDTTPSEMIQDPVNAACLYGIFKSAIIRRSLDGGQTWEDFSDGLELKEEEKKPSVSTSSYRALAAGPDFILTANCSNSAFFRLKSGESKWERIEKESVEVGDWYGAAKGGWFFGGALSSITVSPHDPDHWFFTDFFAIYQTRDAGKTWRLTINGIEVTVTHCLLQDPSDPGIVHLGQADIGSATSFDGGRRFHKNKVPDEKSAPDGGKNMKCIDLSPKMPNRLYSVGDHSYHVGWLANQVFVSEDRGATWKRSPMIGLPDMKKRAATTITADLNDPYTVYLGVAGQVNEGGGGGGVYKSTDGGANWTWMGEGLRKDSWFFPYEIWAHGRQIAAGPDGTLIAISTQSNLCYRFDPELKRWSKSDLPIKGKVWSVVADRLKAGRYFVGVRDSGVFRTDDSGATWKQVYNKSVSYVATDAAVPGRVAGGSADGVILSTDGGESWTTLDKSLPYRFDNIPGFAGDRLIVGSGGSGVFWTPLTPEAAKDPIARDMVRADP